MSDLVSVILPAYNCEKTLADTLESVLNQTYRDIEVILINDAAKDGTHVICESFASKDPRIRYYLNSQNIGTLETRVRAINLARGEWIAFVDSDDLWSHDKLEKQFALQKATNCDLIYTASSFINENGEPFKWIMHVPEQVTYKKLLRQNIISNSSVLMRKRDYLKYSPFSERGNDMHEDFACWLCMLRAGLTARGVNEPLITYRLHKNSSSSNKVNASKLNMNTYKYIGLGLLERYFYQGCYAVNGLRKYMHFR